METNARGGHISTPRILSKLPLRDGNLRLPGLRSPVYPLSKLPLRDGNVGRSLTIWGRTILSKLPLRDGNISGTATILARRLLSKLPLRDGNRFSNWMDGSFSSFRNFL